jgi:ABC-type sugar transport system ATPase subunit
MRADIAALQADFGITNVYVTHDQDEAMTLGHASPNSCSTTVSCSRSGRPRELYERPATSSLAGFIGSPAMNLVPAHLLKRPLGGILGSPSGALSTSTAQGDGIPARVEVVEDIGATPTSSAADSAESRRASSARTDVRSAPQQGERVTLRPRAEEAHLFDARERRAAHGFLTLVG